MNQQPRAKASAQRVRTLQLQRDAVVLPSPVPGRSRSLEPGPLLKRRMCEPKVKGLTLPTNDAELSALEVTRKRRASSESESASTSSELKPERRAGRERTAKRGQKRRLQLIVDRAMGEEMSVLESFSVTPLVRQAYRRRLEALDTFVRENSLRFNTDAESSVGAVFRRVLPERRRQPHGRLHHGGSDRQNPGVRQIGEPKGAERMEMLERLEKVVPVSIAACLPPGGVVRHQHARDAMGAPSEGSLQPPPGLFLPSARTLLKLPKMGLVQPTNSITGCWSLVTSLSETSDTSKTGTKDDSILLDSDWLEFAGPLYRMLTQGDGMDHVWKFNYGDLSLSSMLPGPEADLSAVSGQAFGSQYRSSKGSAIPGRSPEKRRMAESAKHGSLREVREVGSDVEKAGPPDPAVLHNGRAVHLPLLAKNERPVFCRLLFWAWRC